MLSSHSHTSSSSIHLASQVFVVVLCSGLLHCGAVSYVKCIGLYRFGVFCLHRFLSVVVVLVVAWYIVRFLNWTTKFARGKHMSIYILLLLLWGIVDHLLFGQGQVRLGWVGFGCTQLWTLAQVAFYINNNASFVLLSLYSMTKLNVAFCSGLINLYNIQMQM